jgi:4-amino-4-deoxy-L-arabinose transferase-like glycosyltransferase
MQKYSFGLTDLTSFDKPAGEYWLNAAGAARRGRSMARSLTKSMPQAMLAGLCIVAFDGAGNVATVVPLATVH